MFKVVKKQAFQTGRNVLIRKANEEKRKQSKGKLQWCQFLRLIASQNTHHNIPMVMRNDCREQLEGHQGLNREVCMTVLRSSTKQIRANAHRFRGNKSCVLTCPKAVNMRTVFHILKADPQSPVLELFFLPCLPDCPSIFLLDTQNLQPSRHRRMHSFIWIVLQYFKFTILSQAKSGSLLS